MKTRTTKARIASGLMLLGVVSLVIGSAVVSAQEGPINETHHAPENISGTLEGNEVELLSSWRFLSGLAVRLFSGNEAELLSGNSPELLSGNEPELLSGNETRLLSGNEPHLLSGNETTLFSHNTLNINIVESGNVPTLGALAKGLSSLQPQRSQAEMAKLKEVMQAKLKATEAQAKAMIEKEKAEAEAKAKHLIERQRAVAEAKAKELSELRKHIQELATQNEALRRKIEDLSAETDQLIVE